jgi:hypothetical protein
MTTGTAGSCRDARLKTDGRDVRDVGRCATLSVRPGPRGTRCGPVAAASDDDRVRLSPASSFKASLPLPATS